MQKYFGITLMLPYYLYIKNENANIFFGFITTIFPSLNAISDIL